MSSLKELRLRIGQSNWSLGSVPDRTASVVTAAFLGLSVLTAPALAQDASPAAGEVIDPAECQVEPLSDDFLSQLAGTPETTADATPEVAGSPEAFTPPQGEPAGDAEVEAVTMTVREVVACLNSGDYRRVYALYSEEYLRRTLVGGSINIAQATPQPDQMPSQTALIGVSDVVVLEDGRLGARVELATGPEGLQVVLYSVFAQAGDRWLIDEETALEANS